MSADRQTISYLALVFVTGVLVGGTMMNFAEHRILHHHPVEEYDIRQHRIIVQQMGERLSLTPDQKAQVDAILQDAVREYQQIDDEMEPRLDQVREQGRERLRAVLNDQQRAEFEKIVRQVDMQYPRNIRPATIPAPANTATAP